jgi:soluble lytic murein transglycosylase-like protein
MLKLLGLGLLAAAFVLWRRSAEAAVTVPGDLSADPASPSVAVPAGPLGFLALVHQINQQQFGGWFDPALVMGVMQAESSFNPRAYRAEPQINDASYGLMQVLYSTAKDRGFSGAPEGLYDPATNIALGMAQLKWSFDYLSTYIGTPTEIQWLSSYNAGVGYVRNGGSRLLYATKVAGYRDGWRGKVA